MLQYKAQIPIENHKNEIGSLGEFRASARCSSTTWRHIIESRDYGNDALVFVIDTCRLVSEVVGWSENGQTWQLGQTAPDYGAR